MSSSVVHPAATMGGRDGLFYSNLLVLVVLLAGIDDSHGEGSLCTLSNQHQEALPKRGRPAGVPSFLVSDYCCNIAT